MVHVIVLATRNSGKVKEFQQLLEDFPVQIKNLNDFGPIPEVEEDGTTFDDNAYKKASFAAKVLGLPTIADDSGLVVDALFGVPQKPDHHPEIDSGIHTMMVLDQSAKLSEDVVTRFAALVHDLGKAVTPKEQWPSHSGHEYTGLPCIEALCTRLRIPNKFRDLALIACETHLAIHCIEELDPASVLKPRSWKTRSS